MTCFFMSARCLSPWARLLFSHRSLSLLGASSPQCHQLAKASSSSQRWQNRQGKDKFTREARLQGLKSRAAFKLLEINDKYKIFSRGQTVVDLGYAPGSWSQVAVDRTSPNGRVVGIDIIPAQPPKGVSTIQGNFLSTAVQNEVKKFLLNPNNGRPKQQLVLSSDEEGVAMTREDLEQQSSTLLHTLQTEAVSSLDMSTPPGADSHESKEGAVDVVLSDMSAPWEQIDGLWKKSLSNPYYRMMNTSGNKFRDHAGSMDLCDAALRFAFETLRTGGHLVCKYYQGGEEKAFENQLKALFVKVHREKPESSRPESKEAYFVALRRKSGSTHKEVFPNG